MRDPVEERIISKIDAHRDELLAYAEDIYRHPEPGFGEVRTAEKTAAFFKRIGLDAETGLALTGVRAKVSGKGDNITDNDRINIAIIGELDAIGCKEHPFADPVTGVAHACGHHGQLTAMLGAAVALFDEEVRSAIDGDITFLAVPAEEYVPAGRRHELRERGVQFCGSGKSELIRLGVFEDVDIALTTHVHMVPVKESIYLGNPRCNGFSAEMVTVRGKAAHAATAPWDGVNALSITNSAISMMGMLRETFREEDHVRLHNVIRKAGDVINSVPSEAVIETKVRAASLDKIDMISEQIDRCYDGAAYAFGGKIERERLQGYMPVRYREADQVLIDAADVLGLDYRKVTPYDFNNACTDVGDLTQLLPVLNFTVSGFKGSLHAPEFEIIDPELVYLTSAKMFAITAYRLLKQRAAEAKQIIADFEPVFDRESYIGDRERFDF
ncbi:MAG: amidohydrolase [Clostridiales bacterium]|nr:amidohydrolase [Candidatus Blautia equi]